MIPKTLKIGGHIYQVKFPYQFQERTDIVGQHDKSTRQLRITDCDGSGNKRSKSDIYVTLIHEILHGIDTLSGDMIFKDDRENRVEALAEAIFAFLVDNAYIQIENELLDPYP